MNIIELSEPKSVNFGGGIELLMNDKKTDIKLDEITNLEQELNDLVFDSNIETSSFSLSDKPLEFFPSFDEPKTEIKELKPEFKNDVIKLGESTSQSAETKTWDGFNKFNEIPVQEKEPMTKEELLREKLKILRKLEALESKGVNISKKYSMESSLLEMQGEYELIMEEKNKQNSIKFQGNMLMAFINGLEFLNNKFDPFDVKLEGWGEQINENINDYDEIFSELHEKYKSKAKIAPEVKLLFQLAGSGIMIHMTNSMFKTAIPGMDDILRQNPDLMKSFQNAAVNSMGNNPGFSGFMNGLMNPTSSSTYDVGGPPPPLATQGPNAIPPPQRQVNSKPTMQPSYKNTMSMALDSEFRPDMRGPTDINDLLSGLKTKTIDIHQSNSTISLSDLKDLDNDQLPKKSKRRKSDKNVIDLN
uniref:Uncharacterized protein n=1 Tax=viral metagenome TaxID=1070528 RepID=A0A6C0HRA6_9ZZZZ